MSPTAAVSSARATSGDAFEWTALAGVPPWIVLAVVVVLGLALAVVVRVRVVGPVACRRTGKPLLEKDIGGRRPGYADDVRRTRGFVPPPPRASMRSGSAHHVRPAIRRTVSTVSASSAVLSWR